MQKEALFAREKMERFLFWNGFGLNHAFCKVHDTTCLGGDVPSFYWCFAIVCAQ